MANFFLSTQSLKQEALFNYFFSQFAHVMLRCPEAARASPLVDSKDKEALALSRDAVQSPQAKPTECYVCQKGGFACHMLATGHNARHLANCLEVALCWKCQ